MRRLRAAFPLLVLLALASSAAAEEPPEPLGFSLADDWHKTWRRILDRTGRPDPLGPIQQRFTTELYHEYANDLAVGDFPLHKERAWELREHGARFWVHSLDATQLANEVQLKTQTSLGGDWKVAMQFNRQNDRTTMSHLFQVDFTWAPSGDEGLFTTVTIYPRFEKLDTDVEASIGHRSSWGTARARLVSLDAFTNGSYALASGRNPIPEGLPKQLTLPLALAVEASSNRIHGIRGELYAGRILPQKTKLYFSDPKLRNVQTISGSLGGMLVEWKAKTAPLWIGATGLAFHNDWERMHPQSPELDTHVDEMTGQARLYALAAPRDDLHLEGQVRFTARPQSATGPGAPEMGQQRDDDEWLMNLRALWMIGEDAGLDLALWRVHRDTHGAPDVGVEGVGHRFVTRCLLRLGRVWASFGIGWDLDPKKSIYAGGGGAVIINL